MVGATRNGIWTNQCQREMKRLQPEKAKVQEKLKRGKYYEVGDDGELVEVDDEAMLLEEKPKRAMRDDG